jgi:membrane protein
MPEMKMSYWEMIKQTFAEWSEDKATRLSAALAFYTMLSLGPLLILTLKIVSKLYVTNPGAGRARIDAMLGSVTGGQAAGGDTTKVNLVDELIRSAAQPGQGVMASVISGVILLVSASGVFGELQNSMNTIWEVKPKAGRGIMGIIKDRFFSFTLVIGTAFLLLVSLVISAVLTALSERFLPGQGWLWQIVNVLVSLAVVTGLFALMFKYLPDVIIGWRPVLVGAALTAILFTVGKQLLSWYFAHGATGAYGVFGSLVAILLWVYYTGQIVFLGAEFTQVYARATGERIITAPNAVSVREEDEAMQAKSGSVPAGAGEDKQTGGGEPSSGGAAAGAGAGRGGSGAGAGQPWYPAVPVNYNLAVSPSARPSNGSSSTGGKLVPLAIGVALGKFLLGGGKKMPKQPKPKKQFAIGRVMEPGWTTRKRQKEEREITIHVRPPEFVRRAGDRLSEGYERVKRKVREYAR